jgi:hypothetical protein
VHDRRPGDLRRDDFPLVCSAIACNSKESACSDTLIAIGIGGLPSAECPDGRCGIPGFAALLRVKFFGHFEVMLQCRQDFSCPIFQDRIVSALA